MNFWNICVSCPKKVFLELNFTSLDFGKQAQFTSLTKNDISNFTVEQKMDFFQAPKK